MLIRCLQVALVLLVFLDGQAGGGNEKQEKGILVHGHRGSRGTHPENTQAAFEEALEAGADVLELDLQLTQENIPVIWHDAEIRSDICSGGGATVPIRALTVERVKKFDCGNIAQPRFPEQRRVPGSRIMTLEEFFEWANSQLRLGKMRPFVEFNIETKMVACCPEFAVDPQVFVEKVLLVLRRAKVVERTILQSFDFRTLVIAKRLEPRLRLSALFEHLADWCDEARKIGAGSVSPDFKLLTAETVRRCQGLGIQVVPWTLNSADQWRSAVSMKVDAIITDYPRKLLSYFSKPK